MSESDFADRFFWARHRAGLGAPAIAEATGCAQALVSNIEKGAKSSRFNDKFAKLFEVDPNWLRNETGPAPEGFNARAAREMRKNGARKGNVLHLNVRPPRWAGEAPAPSPIDEDDEERADRLQKSLVADFQDYARLVGRERATSFIEILQKITLLVRSSEKSERNSE